MRSSRIATRLAAWPLTAMAAVLLALGGPRGAAADPVSEMSAVGPGAAAIDPGDHSEDFIVDIDVNIDDPTFQGYEYRLDCDSAILTCHSVNQLTPAGMVLCNTPDLSTPGTVKSACAALAQVGAFMGTVEEVTCHCDVPGTSPLTLVDLITDPVFGSSNKGPGGAIIPTTLFSDSVTCGGEVTPTPTATATPGPVGGTAELPEVAGRSLERPDSSGGSVGLATAVAASAAAALVVLGGAGWYARRRWLR